MRFVMIMLLAFAWAGNAVAAERCVPAPLVLAAASLQESMTAAADAWAKRGHPRPIISFAASSALARQVAAGAPADLFVSADQEWMDDLQRRRLIAPGTRANLVGNRLVLVRPATTSADPETTPAGLARALGAAPLAMADPDTVPAGRYGRAALTRLGIWRRVVPQVVRAENVRAALALVARGAAGYGIVYETDARSEPGVRVVYRFAANTHPPITYPIARLKGSSNPEAEGFRAFLLSRAGQAIFARYGFIVR
jgi:molybdate transport system substrate-binding protein